MIYFRVHQSVYYYYYLSSTCLFYELHTLWGIYMCVWGGGEGPLFLASITDYIDFSPFGANETPSLLSIELYD